MWLLLSTDPGPPRPLKTACNLETKDTPDAEFAEDFIKCRGLSTLNNDPNSEYRGSPFFGLILIGFDEGRALI